MCKSCGTRAASLHNPSQSSVILTTVNSDRDFAMVRVGFRSRGALRTNVTSSRDIPRTWRLGYPDERERERERGGAGWEEKENAVAEEWEAENRILENVFAFSRGVFAHEDAGLCYSIRTAHATSQAQLRTRTPDSTKATDVQIHRNWILTSTLPAYPSARRETMPGVRTLVRGRSRSE